MQQPATDQQPWECPRCQRINAFWSARCDCFVTAEGAVSWPGRAAPVTQTQTQTQTGTAPTREVPIWQTGTTTGLWRLVCTCRTNTNGREGCRVHNPPIALYAGQV